MPRNEKHYFVCQFCNKEFYAPRHAHRKPKYCSQKCRGNGLKKRVKIKCQYCNQPFQSLESNKDRQYCSRKCRDKGIVDHSKKDEFTCEWCKQQFESWAYRHNRFCSSQCRSKFAAKQPKLKRRNRVTLICTICNKPYETAKFFANKRNSSFCSKTCKGKDRSNKMTGEKNPNWKGGFNPNDYGSNWSSQSRKARKRDNYTCQICGYYSRIRNLDVHHIVPLITFNGDYISSNQLNNLICLCRKCHRNVELGKTRCPTPKLN